MSLEYHLVPESKKVLTHTHHTKPQGYRSLLNLEEVARNSPVLKCGLSRMAVLQRVQYGKGDKTE